MMPFLVLAAVATNAPSDDIVILGERIRKFRFSIRSDRKSGALTCKIKRASGDAALDASLCDQAKACVAENDGAHPDLPAFEACLTARFEAVRRNRAIAAEGAR